MANTIFDYMQNIKKVISEIPKETERILKSKEELILDLNRENQLFDKGINSDGVKLKPYKPSTIQIKKTENAPFNRTTLFDTGAFTKAFKLKTNDLTFSIFSTDSKSSDLQDKYGSNIFGLTEENQQKTNQIIKIEIEKFIKKYL